MKKEKKFKVDDKILTWFSDEPDGMSRILKVFPYTGRYPQWFTHIVRVTSPRVRKGWVEMAVNEDL